MIVDDKMRRSIVARSIVVGLCVVLASCRDDSISTTTHLSSVPRDVITSFVDSTIYRADLQSGVARKVDRSCRPSYEHPSTSLSSVEQVRASELIAPDGSASAHVETGPGEQRVLVVVERPASVERSRHAFRSILETPRLVWSPTGPWVYLVQDSAHVIALDTRSPDKTARVVNLPGAESMVVTAGDVDHPSGGCR